MISIDKEKRIRSLLETGLTHKEIAQREQVSLGTITTIAGLPGLRIRKKKIIPSELEKLEKPRICPICKAKVTIWPCVLCNPIEPSEHSLSSEIKIIKLTKLLEAYAAEALELFRIVQDLRSLHKLRLIENKLFDILGNRAKDSLDRIFPELEKCDATKKENEATE